MKTILIAAFFVAASTASAQWEFGAVGGGGLLSNASAIAPTGSATAGFAPGFATGAFAGEALNSHISGEIRYEFLQSNLELSSGGQKAQFSGIAHAVHYDVVVHTSRHESRVQFFGVIGGGMKAFVGTGTEAATQPLSQFGYFTKTQTIKPMVNAGAGFVYQISPHVAIRSEVRDFVTQFPTAVITPPQGVKYSSFLQQVVPMVSLVYSK